MAARTVNLIEERDVTVALIAKPLEWRTRVVEELTVYTASSCLRRRSLQVAPIRSHLGIEVPDDATHALVPLFVAPMPRGPLLDFDVEGPEGDGWLLPRLEIAEREALYLNSVAAAAGIELSDTTKELLPFLCGFTGELIADLGKRASLLEYLQQGLGRTLDDAAVQRWRVVETRCRAALRPHLDAFQTYSAPENPALVLPELFAADLITTDLDATAWLESYAADVEALSTRVADAGDPPTSANEFLTALADYANSYDLVAAMKVPLDEPFLVKITDRRDLSLAMFSNEGRQSLVIADAQTNHVTFKVTDPNIRIRDFRALRPDESDFAFGAFQSRSDAQNRAFYAHDVDRDYRVSVAFKLGLLARLQGVPYLTAALLLLTLGLWIEQPRDLPTLALIAGPAALAATVLLAREPSTLGSRLRATSSLAVAIAVCALVFSTVVLFAQGIGVAEGVGTIRSDRQATHSSASEWTSS